MLRPNEKNKQKGHFMMNQTNQGGEDGWYKISSTN